MAPSAQVYKLRLATPKDAQAIQAIELHATAKFHSIPELAHVAQGSSAKTGEAVQEWLTKGKVWLAITSTTTNSTDHDDGDEDGDGDEAGGETPVGIIAALPMDNVIYIAEISVLSEHNGKGLGTMLLNAVLDWAREEAAEAAEAAEANGNGEKKEKEKPKAQVSLTCYATVPWNGPFYRARGFVEVDAQTIGPRHVAKMQYDERVRKLPRPGYPRCCMLWTEAGTTLV